ncbi:MAG: divalent-cation tolerance protein CutA [Chthoniobacteraceae bacterium]
MSALVVLATFPDIVTARRIVRTLVEERLIACGNLVPGVESIYRWKGEVETGAEVLGILKTEDSRFDQLKVRLRELHPYEVPECIALPVADGLPDYLRWIGESVAT